MSLRAARRSVRAWAAGYDVPISPLLNLLSSGQQKMNSDFPNSSQPTSQCLKRLTQEFKTLSSSPTSPPALAALSPCTDTDLLHWRAILLGPPSSPYSHGRWLLSLDVPINYPLAPPHITFLTSCYHPNVHFSTGEICLDLLRKDAWSPAFTLVSALEAVQGLLRWPEEGVDSPLNVDLAALMRSGDRVAWEGMVRFWCEERTWEGHGLGMNEENR